MHVHKLCTIDNIHHVRVAAVSDFEREREILRNEAYPQLQEFFRSNYGLQFRAIDVKLDLEKVHFDAGDYGNLFHDLESRYCFSSSDCVPVVLLGQRFGLPILPKRLPSRVFELIRASLRAHKNPLTRQYALLDDWYRRDENSVDPEHVLLSAHSHLPDLMSPDTEQRLEAAAEWKAISETLSSLFKAGLGFCLQHGTLDESEASELLTFELDSCVSHVLATSDSQAFQPIVMERLIIDLHNFLHEELAGQFTDTVQQENGFTVDKNLHNLLGELSDRLQAFTATHRDPFHVLWRYPGGIDRELHSEYLQEFCQAFVEAAKSAAHARLFTKQIPSDSRVLGVFDDAWNSLERCRFLGSFCPSEDLSVERVVDYILQESEDYALVLHGSNKAAKVPVLATSFLESQRKLNEEADLDSWAPSAVITRLITSSQRLSDLSSSIFNQIRCCMSLDGFDAPRSLSELVECLRGCSVAILIAGTEFLTDDDDEPLDLQFVVPKSLPAGVKLVVTSSGQEDILSLCGDHLRALHLMEPTGESWRSALDTYLASQGRRLLCDGVPTIESDFQACVLFSLLSETSSFDDAKSLLSAGTLEAVVAHLLKVLERKMGPVLVSHAIFYLTLSETGLTDQEVVDILSLDETVLAELALPPDNNVLRFPEPLWLLLKQGLRPLLAESSRDGFLVTYWANEETKAALESLLPEDSAVRQRLHYNMADYFLGTWHGISKPVQGTDLSANRLVPSQKQCYGENFYNERQFRQLPRHLCLSRRIPEMQNLVLFSYDWLYCKTRCLGLEETLKDFELVQQNLEVSLVEEALRKSAVTLSENLSNLGAELSGQLISYSYLYKNIKNLVYQADIKGCKHNVFLPSYPYAKLPGSALQATVHCPHDLLSLCINGDFLFVKLKNSTALYKYDLTRSEMAAETDLSSGELHLSTDQQFSLVLDTDRRHSIKVHRTQSGEFLGHLVPLNWIDPLPFEEKHMFRITGVCVGKSLVATVTTARVSVVMVSKIETCQPVHIFKPERRAALCHLSPDERFLFTNNDEQVIVFEIGTGVQTAAVDLLAKPTKLIFTKDGQRVFILCEGEQKIVILFMGEGGSVEMSYKIMFENSLQEDSLMDMRLSQQEHLLLVRGLSNVLVYDFTRDAIITHIKRPVEIPREFKMPNSSYESIDFSEADFAFDDRVVVTAIFRDVLVWQVDDGKPLVMLHAPTGILSRLLVDQERSALIGYIGHSREIHMWNLQGAFTDGTVIDCLTAPIEGIRTSDASSRAVAFCSKSDEMGVIDLSTGFLTDLYSHEGQVQDCVLSNCGDYALVSVEQRSPGTTHILWSLSQRKIITEFGNVPAQMVPCATSCGFYLIGQAEVTYKEPYKVTRVSVTDGSPIMGEEDLQVTFLLNKIFLTAQDKFLVMLSADDIEDCSGTYKDVQITALNTGTLEVRGLTPGLLSNFTLVRDLLEVRPCSQSESGVLILYTDSESTHSMSHHVLTFDLEKMQALNVIQTDCPLAKPLLFSPCGMFCVAKGNQLMSLESGVIIGQVAAAQVKIHGFMQNLLIGSCGQHLLAYRLPEATLVGKVSAHEDITAVTLCRDALVLVGCSSGNVFSYTVIDAERQDVLERVHSIPSREVLNSEKARSWDRLLMNDKGGELNYSRPTSVKPEAAVPVQRRAHSDSSAELQMSRTRSCSVM